MVAQLIVNRYHVHLVSTSTPFISTYGHPLSLYLSFPLSDQSTLMKITLSFFILIQSPPYFVHQQNWKIKDQIIISFEEKKFATYLSTFCKGSSWTTTRLIQYLHHRKPCYIIEAMMWQDTNMSFIPNEIQRTLCNGVFYHIHFFSLQ